MGACKKFENHSGIYEIKNIINGKRYIGQARNLRKRKSQHFAKLKRNEHGNQHLQNSFNKYGYSNFEFSIILYCELSELTYYEQKVMDVLHPEYNKRPAADSNVGIKPSRESNIKRSLAMKGRVHSEESIRKMSESKMGHSVSEETLKKLSESHKGQIQSKESREKASISLQGKKRENSTSKYIGVHFSEKDNGWLSEINYHKKRFRIGCYDDEMDAALAYNKKAIEIYGSQAVINNIENFDFVEGYSKRKRKASSKYKGVSFVKRIKKWSAQIYCNPEFRIHVGYFKTEIEAAIAYNAKCIEIFGDNAKLNIIEEKED